MLHTYIHLYPILLIIIVQNIEYHYKATAHIEPVHNRVNGALVQVTALEGLKIIS